MQGHEDIPTFIHTFAGDHRYIADYLVEEAFARSWKEGRAMSMEEEKILWA